MYGRSQAIGGMTTRRPRRRPRRRSRAAKRSYSPIALNGAGATTPSVTRRRPTAVHAATRRRAPGPSSEPSAAPPAIAAAPERARRHPRAGRHRIRRVLPDAEGAHEDAPPPALLAQAGHVDHDARDAVLRHAQPELDRRRLRPVPRAVVAAAELVKEGAVREVREEPRGRERDARRRRRAVAGDAQRTDPRGLPVVARA